MQSKKPNYYPFGMVMPERKFTIASAYRYGFNGKENENEVKGEGNQQDYGMRIYDPRVGKFLSVDPLTAKYPFYTPYAFAGNDVIRSIDLDGTEPTCKTEEWKGRNFKSTATSIDVYDKVNHQVFEAHIVNDPNSGKSWIIADDGQGQGRYSYLRNDNKSTNSIEYYYENGRNYLVNGHFEQFETQNQKEARFDREIARGFGIAVFGFAGAATSMFAAPTALASAAVAPAAEATVTTRLANTTVDYAAQVAGNYASGKSGSDAWAGNINITSLSVSFVNPGTNLSKLALNNTASSFVSITASEGYNGVGAGKSIDVAITQSVIGTVAGRFTRGTDLKINQLSGRLLHANSLYGSNSTLSTTLQSAIRNTSVVGTTIGVISSGSGNALNNKIEENR